MTGSRPCVSRTPTTLMMLLLVSNHCRQDVTVWAIFPTPPSPLSYLGKLATPLQHLPHSNTQDPGTQNCSHFMAEEKKATQGASDFGKGP